MWRIKTTEGHKRYWQNRQIDWTKDYTSTWSHPHRYMISAVLKTFSWFSLFEVGCGAGANLINIVKNFPNCQLGGVDISSEAIATGEKTLKGAVFKVGSGDDIMMSDDSADVILSDMCLIYVSPWDINRYLKEIKRVTRQHVILCEFHSESFWSRMKLRITSGYNAYNYRKLLQKHDFYDIMTYKIPLEAWPGGEPQKTFGYIIHAKVFK